MFSLEAGVTVVTTTHTGASNFIVRLRDSNGQTVETIAYHIGDFSGVAAFNVAESGSYLVQVVADGSWTIALSQPGKNPGNAVAAPTTFTGRGKDVRPISLNAGLVQFTMNHDGVRNFIVHLLDSDGNIVEFLVNEIGAYSGTTAAGAETKGVYWLDVVADGNWSITIQ